MDFGDQVSQAAPEDADLPFRQVARDLPTPCWISDAEGKVLWVNRAWIDYTGFDVARITELGLQRLHDPALFPEVQRRWAQTKARGEPAEMVFPLLGRDGRLRPFLTRVAPLRDGEGRITRWFGTNTDISAQSEAERKLRSSQIRFRELFDGAADAIFVIDSAGRVLDANPAAAALTGHEPSVLSGLHFQDLAQTTLATPWAPDSPAMPELSGALRRRDGALVEVELSVGELRDGERLIVGRDVSARRKAEARLIASEARFRQLADQLPVMIWEGDEDARTIWRNRAMNRFYGPRSEDGSSALNGLIHPDDRSELLNVYQGAWRDAAPYGAEARLRRADGAWRICHIEGVPRLDEEGRAVAFMGAMVDITESRMENAALVDMVGAEAAKAARAQRQLAKFWEASHDLLAVVSMTTGVAQLLNEAAWQATLGHGADPLMQRPLLELVHPDDLQNALAWIERLANEGSVYGVENRYRHADGHWVWLSWNMVRDGEVAYGIARDITHKIEAEAALAQSERQFRLLVAGVVDYALCMLSPEGLVTNWNAGAEHIKGYPASEVIGRHFSMFYTDGDRAAELPARALRTATEQGRYEAEAWRVRRDGSLFWANVVIDPIRDETGHLIGFAKITRDITQQRASRIELQQAQERLSQAQKMEAIGQLTGGVAHDFNNLLMVVGGQAQLLRRKFAPTDPAASRSLDAIDIATRRGQDLTRHLLAFARRQRLTPSPMSLASRRIALEQLLATSVGSTITVTLDLPDDLWWVNVDAGELELAILNMAVNARDAMPEGGALAISARNVTTTPVGSETPGDFISITVSDTGEGIAADLLPKVFEPFFTTKAVNKGTGLGLSQVYGFVRQSGGHIHIESQINRGTMIEVLLPRCEASPAQPAADNANVDGASAAIMLVEDNPEVAEVAAALLSQLGHRVTTAASADAALSLLEGGAKPDLLFSDIVMAGRLDGLALARHVRRLWPDMPILLATGYSEAAERMPPGEFPILSKPYQLDDLNRTLGAVLAREGH